MIEKDLSRRERKKLVTRANIIKNARRLFQKNGYEETAIEEITELADVSKGTFFNYFTSKEHLLFGIAEEEVNDVFEMMESKDYIESNSLQKIEQILERLLIDSIPYLQLTGRLVFMTIISNSNSESPFTRITKEIEELIGQAQSQQIIKSEFNKSDIATALMSGYYGVLFKWFENGGQSGTVEDLHRVLNIIYSGLTNRR